MMKDKITARSLSPLAVVAAGCMWGCMGLFVRHYDGYGIDSMGIVGFRSIVTVAILGLFLLITDKNLLKIKLKDAWCFVGTGIMSMVFFNYCYFKAIVITDLSVAAVLLYTAPAFVLVISALLFKEKLTMKQLLSLVLAFLGCVLVTGVLGSDIVLGGQSLLIGLGAGIGYALYSIFSRFALNRGYESLTITFWTFVFASLGSIPFITGDFPHLCDVMAGSPGRICFTLLFVVESTVLPYIIYTWGLSHMKTGTAAIIASIEPVVATLIGVLVYQEALTLLQLAGIVMVLGSVVLCSQKGSS